MSQIKRAVFLVLALGLAFGVTLPKLYKMCQIKGWAPGATTSLETITQKWNQAPAQHPRGRDTYWISWSDKDIQNRGNHRLNVSPETWNKYAIGPQVEVVQVPGDGSLYLRDGIFVSAGNFGFDTFLLAAELGMAVLMGVGLIRKRRKHEDAT